NKQSIPPLSWGFQQVNKTESENRTRSPSPLSVLAARSRPALCLAASKEDYSLETYVLSQNKYQIELLANLDKSPSVWRHCSSNIPVSRRGISKQLQRS